MNKQLSLLAIAAIFGSYLEAATQYIVGPEIDGVRSDIIRLGSAGGFNGFTQPSGSVKTLNIQLMPSGTAVESNTIPTFADYDGTGTMPYLASTVKDVYVTGNAADWATLVLGNSAHGLYDPALSPGAYGLPTPWTEATVHFALSQSPADVPELWFQGRFLAKSRVVVEPNSQDPCLSTLVLYNGGTYVIGSPVVPAVGFSDALNSGTGAVTIQRHPKVKVNEVVTQASMTLAEDTIFNCLISGISIAGDFSTTFNKNAYLIDPAADFAGAHISVGPNATVEVYASERSLPAFANVSTAAGGKSTFKPSCKAQPLPALNPSLK